MPLEAPEQRRYEIVWKHLIRFRPEHDHYHCHYLLPDGAKLRLDARFAKLESRSPVTSLLAADDDGTKPEPLLAMGDITEATNQRISLSRTMKISYLGLLELHQKHLQNCCQMQRVMIVTEMRKLEENSNLE